MTREESRKAAEVMLAYADGKEIEYSLELTSKTVWFSARTPVFNWGCGDYRIKQEPTYRIKPKPTYRPFKDKEECWAEMQKHQPFGWVMDKNTKDYQNLLILGGAGYELLFQHSVFVDGTPFGIEVKE